MANYFQHFSRIVFVVAAGALLVASGASCAGDDDSEPISGDIAAKVGQAEIPKRALDEQIRQAKQIRAQNPDVTLDLSRAALLSALIQAEWREQEVRARTLKLPRPSTTGAADRRDVVFTALTRSLKPYSAFPVSEAEIREYLINHKEQLTTPKRREVLVVETTKKADADKAKLALNGGAGWEDVIARYGRDTPALTEDRVGLTSVYEGQLAPGLDKAVFSARVNAISGPVRSEGVWYVFDARRETRKRTPTMENSRKAITFDIQADKRGRYVDRFLKRLRLKYRAQTLCNEDLLVPDCRNGPQSRGPAS